MSFPIVLPSRVCAEPAGAVWPVVATGAPRRARSDPWPTAMALSMPLWLVCIAACLAMLPYRPLGAGDSDRISLCCSWQTIEELPNQYAPSDSHSHRETTTFVGSQAPVEICSTETSINSVELASRIRIGPLERTLGTAISWESCYETAAQQAWNMDKLLLVMQVSGNFELQEFT